MQVETAVGVCGARTGINGVDDVWGTVCIDAGSSAGAGWDAVGSGVVGCACGALAEGALRLSDGDGVVALVAGGVGGVVSLPAAPAVGIT